ncbi:MAG: hypothetical protein IKZ14_07650 [Muribaculaceae bacterium]|nr:hypothetical protein [Muribaculaceae bacterium]
MSKPLGTFTQKSQLVLSNARRDTGIAFPFARFGTMRQSCSLRMAISDFDSSPLLSASTIVILPDCSTSPLSVFAVSIIILRSRHTCPLRIISSVCSRLNCCNDVSTSLGGVMAAYSKAPIPLFRHAVGNSNRASRFIFTS